MNGSLNLLHLSDLHICDKDTDYLQSIHGIARYVCGGPALQTEYSRLRKAIESLARDTDWLIITGDITHTGRIADLGEAIGFMEGVEGDLSRENAGGKGSLALIPGNHDRYRNKGPDPGNVGPFESRFGKYWDVGQGIQFRVLSEELRIQAGFVDFSLRKSDAVNLPKVQDWGRQRPSAGELKRWLSLWGQGCVYEDLLKQLKDETAAHIAAGWKVIWVIHFAPFPRLLNKVGQWKLQLRNEERLVSSAKELGVRHIFCGHTHEQDHYSCNGVEVFCAGPSLRDSRLSKACFLFVRLSVNEHGLKTLSCEEIARSTGGYSGGPLPKYIGA